MLTKFSAPFKIGLGFGLAGIVLVIVGVVRGNVPANPASIAMALLIGGGFWFLVAWAVARTAADVESDTVLDADALEGNLEPAQTIDPEPSSNSPSTIL